jgi:hypothetical protein
VGDSVSANRRREIAFAERIPGPNPEAPSTGAVSFLAAGKTHDLRAAMRTHALTVEGLPLRRILSQ